MKPTQARQGIRASHQGRLRLELRLRRATKRAAKLNEEDRDPGAVHPLFATIGVLHVQSCSNIPHPKGDYFITASARRDSARACIFLQIMDRSSRW
jgi:hypothetical protein